ncbi:hypothetical protein [Kineococcus rhizosphaerae]|uniref:Uncharacterized protein n=1 Tax=Kineococcus rhizosphaerae TaxID=559628 RepID=A0A2T0RB02_9ACTN|nr:hypothetical protein [Kineococcus rhizosphaerae]PRY18344.1 hypothetical protein CLV37_101589 [Kineococcus rhizosphaerae]
MFERPRRHGPPGWPREVPPPDAEDVEDWRVDAVAWLLDQAPPEFRGYPAVRHHPVLLAWLVGHHVAAQQEAVRRALGTARRDLAHRLPPEVAPAVFDVLEREDLRLRRLARAVDLLQQALDGRKFVPRL